MGWNCLDYCVSHPAFMWLWHGTQAVLFTVASSMFPLQPRNWATQSPSQDLFIYTLVLISLEFRKCNNMAGWAGMEWVPQGRCVHLANHFFPILEILEDLCWTTSMFKGEKSIFKHPGTVRSTWRGKGESSAVDNIYNIIPGACKNSRSRFCTGARVFVISLPSSRSQVQLPWQKCCVRAEEVSLLVIRKEMV